MIEEKGRSEGEGSWWRRLIVEERDRRGGEGATVENIEGKAWVKTSIQSIGTARLELCRNLSITGYSSS